MKFIEKVQTFVLKHPLVIGALFVIVITLFVVDITSGFIKSEIAVTRDRLKVASEDMANQIHLKMNRAFEINRFNKSILKASALRNFEHSMSREEVLQHFRDQLNDNPDFLGLYTLWEPDAFDHQDAQYRNKLYHDSTGRFIPYVFRTDKGIRTEPCMYYDQEGIGNYYQLPRQLKKEVMLDPYKYPIEGKEVWMVSAISPILIDGTFKGITGTDFRADFLQKMVDEFKFAVSEVEVMILSSNGVIVAMKDHPQFIGLRLEELPGTFDMEQLQLSFAEGMTENHSFINFCAPVTLSDTGTPWKVCISVPKEAFVQKTAGAKWKLVLIGVLLIIFFILLRSQGALVSRINRQEARLSALVNSTEDLIFSVDKDQKILEFNNAFREAIRKAFNVELEKGMDFNNFVYPELREGSDRNFKRALTGETVKAGAEFKGWDGKPMIIDTIHTPIYSSRKEVIGVTTISRNITESKLAERELIEINKQMAEYKLMALRSVMNPHFLFNALNSIQYFVVRNERKMALDYLSIFSSLIRKLLNSSASPSIPLHKELEILNNYIILEKLRFEGKFDYSIEVQEGIDTAGIFIPPLLIQPFVENAILHGLMNKDGNGSLKINIYRKDHHLMFEVEDDGVGRKRAREIKIQQQVREGSDGMLLTRERLDMIYKTSGVSIEVEDLENEEGIALGTRATISIKI